LILFSSLTETIGTTFQSHLNDLQPILLKCLQDEASSRVRIAALKAVGSFIEYVNDGGDVVSFSSFLPPQIFLCLCFLSMGKMCYCSA
jgi:hypothetical protein